MTKVIIVFIKIFFICIKLEIFLGIEKMIGLLFLLSFGRSKDSSFEFFHLERVNLK